MAEWEVEKIKPKVTIKDIIGDSLDDVYQDFDMTEVQELVFKLQNSDIPDISHAEHLQQQALRCADILSEYIGKLVKIIHYLEAKVASAKNKASLDYKTSDGRTTMEMKKWAGEVAPEVEDLQIRLAKAKGSKAVLDKKYEIVIKSHHHYKEIAGGLRKTILGYTPTNSD
jgi:hypothetical protein